MNRKPFPLALVVGLGVVVFAASAPSPCAVAEPASNRTRRFVLRSNGRETDVARVYFDCGRNPSHPCSVKVVFETFSGRQPKKTVVRELGETYLSAAKTRIVRFPGSLRPFLFVSVEMGGVRTYIFDYQDGNLTTPYQRSTGRVHVFLWPERNPTSLVEQWNIHQYEDANRPVGVSYRVNDGIVRRTLVFDGKTFAPQEPGPPKLADNRRTSAR